MLATFAEPQDQGKESMNQAGRIRTFPMYYEEEETVSKGSIYVRGKETFEGEWASVVELGQIF